MIKLLKEWLELPQVTLIVKRGFGEIQSWEYKNYLNMKFIAIDLHEWDGGLVLTLKIESEVK